jgi:hypothetical protein
MFYIKEAKSEFNVGDKVYYYPGGTQPTHVPEFAGVEGTITFKTFNKFENTWEYDVKFSAETERLAEQFLNTENNYDGE